MKNPMCDTACLFFGTTSGSTGLTYSLCKELNASGKLKKIFLSNRNDIKKHFDKEFESKIVYFDPANSIKRFFNIFNLIYIYFSILKSIYKFKLKKLLISMHHPWSIILIIFLWPFIRISSVIHDSKPHDGDNKLLTNFTNFLICIFSNKIIFLSKIQMSILAKTAFTGIILKYRDVSYVKHPSFFHYKSDSFNNDYVNYKYDFVFLGRLEPYKGLDMLLKAFKIFKKKFKKNSSLLIAGKPSKNFEINNFKYDGIEVLAKYICDDNIPKIINSGSVVVIPYLEATQSGLVLLANDFRKTCVITPCVGLIEQVNYCGQHIMSKDFTSESFANAMNESLDIKLKNFKNIYSDIQNHV